MLHAISVPQTAPVSKYVQEHLLVALTPVERKSCGQPLRRYPAASYEAECHDSDTRCRSGTKSGDFRPKSGKTRTIRMARWWLLLLTAPECHPVPGTRDGTGH